MCCVTDKDGTLFRVFLFPLCGEGQLAFCIYVIKPADLIEQLLHPEQSELIVKHRRFRHRQHRLLKPGTAENRNNVPYPFADRGVFHFFKIDLHPFVRKDGEWDLIEIKSQPAVIVDYRKAEKRQIFLSRPHLRQTVAGKELVRRFNAGVNVVEYRAVEVPDNAVEAHYISLLPSMARRSVISSA